MGYTLKCKTTNNKSLYDHLENVVLDIEPGKDFMMKTPKAITMKI